MYSLFMNGDDLTKELDFYKSILGSINGAIYIVNLDPYGLTWISYNKWVEILTGVPYENIVSGGEAFVKNLMMHNDFAEASIAATKYFMENPDGQWVGVYRAKNSLDEMVWLLYNAVVFKRDDKGQAINNLCMTMDITNEINTNNLLMELMRGKLRVQYKGVYDLFSKREIEVIREIANGLTTKEIGQKLFISENTVETHRSRILKKSGERNIASLVAKVERAGMLL